MSMNDVPLAWLRALSILGAGSLLGLVPFALALSQREALRTPLQRYVARLSADLDTLRARVSPRVFVLSQGASLVVASFFLLIGMGLLALPFVVAPLALRWTVSALCRVRTTRIEAQLDGFLLGLSSSLRATPALGEAIEHSLDLMAPPLRDEIELLVREQRLGAPLDEVLERMGKRVGSRTLDAALGTLRIGRALGGDVPGILERSAATLREMARLEGVVRTKTAEGKAQATVLALLPFALCGLLHEMTPGFLAPLFASLLGHVILAGSLTLWVMSLAVAWKVLRVDI